MHTDIRTVEFPLDSVHRATLAPSATMHGAAVTTYENDAKRHRGPSLQRPDKKPLEVGGADTEAGTKGGRRSIPQKLNKTHWHIPRQIPSPEYPCPLPISRNVQRREEET